MIERAPAPGPDKASEAHGRLSLSGAELPPDRLPLYVRLTGRWNGVPVETESRDS